MRDLTKSETLVLIVNLTVYPSIVNLPIGYLKKERVTSVFVLKKDLKNLEKNNSPKERCPGMMGVAAPSLKKKLPKWNLLVSSPSFDFEWVQDRSSLKTSSMEKCVSIQ